MPGGAMPWQPSILSDQLTLSQPERADYAPQITTGTPGFSGLPSALIVHRSIFVETKVF